MLARVYQRRRTVPKSGVRLNGTTTLPLPEAHLQKLSCESFGFTTTVPEQSDSCLYTLAAEMKLEITRLVVGARGLRAVMHQTSGASVLTASSIITQHRCDSRQMKVQVELGA